MNGDSEALGLLRLHTDNVSDNVQAISHTIHFRSQAVRLVLRHAINKLRQNGMR
jgi:hypothetical protein